MILSCADTWFDAQAWPNHKDNLIVIERYHFFASSCRQFDHKYKSLSELKSDESEPDGALATVLKVLKQAHALFFEVCQICIYTLDQKKSYLLPSWFF